VADKQFAPLGLVLMALLARTSRVINARGYYAAISHKSHVEKHMDMALSYAEDLGETVSRHMDSEVSTSTEGLRTTNHARVFEKRIPDQALKLEDESGRAKITRLGKRRRKGNAIDDIFNPLISG
jgi:hypothetical protein